MPLPIENSQLPGEQGGKETWERRLCLQGCLCHPSCPHFFRQSRWSRWVGPAPLSGRSEVFCYFCDTIEHSVNQWPSCQNDS